MQRPTSIARPTGTASRLGCLGILALAALARAGANGYMPLERNYTLKEGLPHSLEAEYSRLVLEGAPTAFIFPRPCVSPLDSSRACPETARLAWSDPAHRAEARLSPVAAYEFRSDPGATHAAEGGALLDGSLHDLAFGLDMRTFVELDADSGTPSFDREFVERQREAESHSVAYASYSRYRANLSLDLGWARIAFLRDAVHWGPGLFANLTFNQDAVPFNQLAVSADLGPFSILSLYGQLSLNDPGDFRDAADTRSLYAHRYVWRAPEGLTLGASETLILYDREAPFAFAPIVPLFIAKGFENESVNNGSLAFDANWNLPGLLSVYGEFYIDDMVSPTSLFDSQWGNKWAAMAGAHFARATRLGTAGLVLEYSHVEPWVYTHYEPRTAQAANQGVPLGNPLGPDSRWLVGKAYLRARGGYYLGARAEARWKGTRKGSSLTDIHVPGESIRKHFLADDPGPASGLIPEIGWNRGMVSAFLSARLGDRPGASARLAIVY